MPDSGEQTLTGSRSCHHLDCSSAFRLPSGYTAMTTVRCGIDGHSENASHVARTIRATKPNSAVNSLNRLVRKWCRTFIAKTLFAAISAGVELQCKSQLQKCATRGIPRCFG